LKTINSQDKKVLLVTASYDQDLLRSSSNLKKVSVEMILDLNAWSVLNGGSLLLTEEAFEKIKANLAA
jgi:ribosomal protein L4